jgi:hypothetical protein
MQIAVPAQPIDSSHHTARGDSLQTTWEVACGGKKTCMNRASRKREAGGRRGKCGLGDSLFVHHFLDR